MKTILTLLAIAAVSMAVGYGAGAALGVSNKPQGMTISTPQLQGGTGQQIENKSVNADSVQPASIGLQADNETGRTTQPAVGYGIEKYTLQ